MIKTSNMRKIVSALLVSAIALTGTMSASASVISNAQSAINDANNQMNEANNTISNIENQQAELQTEIDAIDAELVGILLDIEVLTDEIAAKEEAIAQTTEQLAKAEEEQVKQYDAMKLRMRFMYENSNTNIVTALLSAQSIADFVNRVEYFNQIYAYDRNQLTEYKNIVAEVKEQKETLEQEYDDMEQLKENYEHQSAEMQAILDSKRATMTDFDYKLAAAKDLVAKYKETIRQQNQIIANEQARIEQQRREEEERRRREQEQNNNNNNNNNNNSNNNNSSNNNISNNNNSSSDSGNKNPSYATSINGQDVVDFAMQYIGNPYVWGGTSLTNGCDCSGFVMKVYEHFGVSLPHSSYSQRSCGKSVSLSNAKPGDIVCYSGHVIIYIGNGMGVGAQSSKIGIATTRVNYRTIVDVRRVL